MLNRNAGVYIQRGSGAESLGAIRSPVLAGAGACGAFLVAEDSLPIRPVGFCNLNEMFELNYEQAGQIEVLRGPGSAMFGASAVHGVVNRAHAHACAQLPEFALGIEGGSDSFKRVTAQLVEPGSDRTAASGCMASRRALRAGATPRASTKPSSICWEMCDVGGGNLRLRAAGTVLNQETAGFIQGYNSYHDEDIARAIRIPKRFAMPRARASRRTTSSATAFGDDCRFELAGIYRRSRMDFLQHFLIGKPLEHNAQTSYMLSGTAAFPTANFLTTRVTVDAETGGLRAHRVPAGTGHRRRAAGQCHSSGGLSLRLHRGLQDAGRHARARLPHRPTTSRSPRRCAPTRLTTTTTIT